MKRDRYADLKFERACFFGMVVPTILFLVGCMIATVLQMTNTCQSNIEQPGKTQVEVAGLKPGYNSIEIIFKDL